VSDLAASLLLGGRRVNAGLALEVDADVELAGQKGNPRRVSRIQIGAHSV
jgi:hypothetical protein